MVHTTRRRSASSRRRYKNIIFPAKTHIPRGKYAGHVGQRVFPGNDIAVGHLRQHPDLFAALQGAYPEALLRPADDHSFGTEFLDYKMALKTVDSLDGALQHIACYSSQHSECIVSEDTGACARFTREVDAACVYTNVSTAFTDGGQFGFGAEIGISTQKLHARGPMALPELTSYKYIVTGNGQVRK